MSLIFFSPLGESKIEKKIPLQYKGIHVLKCHQLRLSHPFDYKTLENLTDCIKYYGFSGSGGVGLMDILASSGLINYFGKWTNLCQIDVAPLVFSKASSKIALYGLSYMNDQRLSRLIRDSKESATFVTNY